MRFKNRYYLVEIAWEGNAAAAATSAASVAAASASPATPAQAYAAAPGSAAAASLSAPLPTLSLRAVDPALQSITLQHALREALRDNFGDLVAGRTMQSLQVRYLNSLTNTAIVRVARDDHRALGATLCFLTALRARPCILRTVHVGGTIRCCQKAAVRLQRKRMDELRAQLAAAAAATGVRLESGAGSASTTAGAGNSAPTLSDALAGATARPNQAAARNAQQTLRQLATMLSTYRGTQAALAAQSASAASAAATANLAAQLARSEQAVLPTVAAISEALEAAAAKADEEVMAMQV